MKAGEHFNFRRTVNIVTKGECFNFRRTVNIVKTEFQSQKISISGEENIRRTSSTY